MTVIVLPLPPSINGYYRNRTQRDNRNAPGRIKTARAQAWELEALAAIRDQAIGRTPGPVRLQFQFKRPRKNSDLSNLIKKTEDILVVAGVIDDDRNVQYLSAEWADIEGCVCYVTPHQP